MKFTFSEELLLPLLASDDVRLRADMVIVCEAMISSSLASLSGDVVRKLSSRIS